MKIVNKNFTSPWQVGGHLWKPVGEHTGNPVSLSLEKMKVQKVFILDKDKNKIKELKYGSTNPDVAFRDPYQTADKYPQPVYVRLIKKTKAGELVCWDYFLRNPLRRSDGRKGEGNYVK